MRLVLTEDHALEIRLERAELLGVGLRDLLGRDARHLGDDDLDLARADLLAALAFRHEPLGSAGFVDHVDRLVRQLAVGDVAGRQIHRGADGFVGVLQAVEFLEIRLEAHHDLDRVFDRRLDHVDLLEAAGERPVLLEVLAVFLVGCRAHAAQRARLKRRLQQVGRIHRAAGRRAGADDGVDLVDEENGFRLFLEFLHDGFQTLFEVAAIAGAGEQRAHVERVDDGVGEDAPGASPSTIFLARPSAMAVLPTPGSPTSSGLFLRRRQRTWIARSTSAWRPMSGSVLPSRAFWLRSTQ